MSAAARSRAVDEAAERLYGLPLTRFVEERKAAAKALRAAGDKAAAKAVDALPRPTLSAWAVNQLHRQSEHQLEALFTAAQRMKRGDLDARDAHRDALAALRGRAAQILVTDGHAASEGTLRRIATTLQALAVQGSFEPDAPGQLVADRDPPGFEAMLGAELGEPPPPRAAPPRKAAERDDDDGERERQRAEAARAAAEKERQRAVERQTRELARIESELAEARRVAAARERDIRDLSERLARAQEAMATAETRAAELEDTRARAAALLVELTDARGAE